MRRDRSAAGHVIEASRQQRGVASRPWAYSKVAVDVSGTTVLLCMAAFVLIGWPRIVELVSAREGTIPALALIALIGLAVGHALGGPNADDRTVLAFASVSRHPGVAIVVATLTDQVAAPVGVLLAVAVTEVAVVPYKIWRTRTRAGPPAAAPPPSRAH